MSISNTTRTIGIAAVILIIVGIIASYALRMANTQQDAMMKDNANTSESVMNKNENEAIITKEEGAMMEKSDGAAPDEEGAMMNKNAAGSSEAVAGYVDYSSEVFAAAQDQKRVLYFHADWCPVCRPLDRELSARESELPSTVVVFKTNYDAEKELKQQYGVTYQHTFVQVDATGRAIAKWNGGGFDDILKNIK